MNKLTLDEQWPVLKSKAGSFFTSLNAQDWQKIDQDVRQFAPVLQERYGYTSAQAEAEIDRFLADQGEGQTTNQMEPQDAEGQPGVPRQKKPEGRPDKLVENINDAPDAVKPEKEKGADNTSDADKKELLEDLKADSLGGMTQLDSQAT